MLAQFSSVLVFMLMGLIFLVIALVLWRLLRPAGKRGAKLRPIARKPGALARFLESRE